jgi:hypothetical protein
LVSELTSVISDLCVPTDLERVASLWDRCVPESRGYLMEAIGHLRFPDAEPFLLGITEASEDLFVRTLGALGLCEMLCTSDASRQRIGQMIDDEDYDPSLVDLAELAIPLGTILDSPFPNEEQWRKRLNQTYAKAAARWPNFGASFGGWEAPTGRESASQEGTARSGSPYAGEPGEVVQLTRAKGVGRNDPCPCGSGKKYKKCCLSKT